MPLNPELTLKHRVFTHGIIPIVPVWLVKTPLAGVPPRKALIPPEMALPVTVAGESGQPEVVPKAVIRRLGVASYVISPVVLLPIPESLGIIS